MSEMWEVCNFFICVCFSHPNKIRYIRLFELECKAVTWGCWVFNRWPCYRHIYFRIIWYPFRIFHPHIIWYDQLFVLGRKTERITDNFCFYPSFIFLACRLAILCHSISHSHFAYLFPSISEQASLNLKEEWFISDLYLAKGPFITHWRK